MSEIFRYEGQYPDPTPEVERSPSQLLFAAVANRYGEALVNEYVHTDRLYIETGRQNKQSLAVFNLVDSYESLLLNQAETLRIFVPTAKMLDKFSGLEWLRDDKKTDRSVIVRHTTPNGSRSFRITEAGTEPYPALGRTGHYTWNARKNFIPRMIDKIQNPSFKVIAIKYLEAAD